MSQKRKVLPVEPVCTQPVKDGLVALHEGPGAQGHRQGALPHPIHITEGPEGEGNGNEEQGPIEKDLHIAEFHPCAAGEDLHQRFCRVDDHIPQDLAVDPKRQEGDAPQKGRQMSPIGRGLQTVKDCQTQIDEIPEERGDDQLAGMFLPEILPQEGQLDQNKGHTQEHGRGPEGQRQDLGEDHGDAGYGGGAQSAFGGKGDAEAHKEESKDEDAIANGQFCIFHMISPGSL